MYINALIKYIAIYLHQYIYIYKIEYLYRYLFICKVYAYQKMYMYTKMCKDVYIYIICIYANDICIYIYISLYSIANMFQSTHVHL